MDHLELARICEQAYEESTISTDNGTQFLLRSTPDKTIIAFRGTESNFEDILTDLRALPTWSPELQRACHSGFLSGALSTLPAIKNIAHRSPIVLTGHSLGGALARLTKALLNIECELVTFGEPRSMFGWSGVHGTRYVNGNDCVPSHPWAMWGYRHQDPETLIGKPGGRYTMHKISQYINTLERQENE